jgi:hypothetical protein
VKWTGARCYGIGSLSCALFRRLNIALSGSHSKDMPTMTNMRPHSTLLRAMSNSSDGARTFVYAALPISANVFRPQHRDPLTTDPDLRGKRH